MANLPADLPTNWTQGQIISPNGTEVGLTEQYGYNYLNEQVNNTQTEVNSLSTAQTNTQQQVNTLNTQVGNIQGQVTTQGQSITALQETTTSQGQSITSLQSQVSSNDTDIAGLQQTTTTQGQNITTLQGQVSTLNQTTTTQGENISTLQSEVSAINTALDGVAQESSVQDIIDSIGTTADTGGSATAGTLMAKTNRLISDVLELKEEPYIVSGVDGYTPYVLDDNIPKLNGAWKTVANVTGEGFLSGFLFTAGSASSSDYTSGLKITIDNNLIFSQPKAPAKSRSNYIGLLNINYLCFSDSVRFGPFFVDNNYLRFFNRSKINYSTTDEYVVSGREIPFKQNLKIEVYCDTDKRLDYFGIYHIKNI